MCVRGVDRAVPPYVGRASEPIDPATLRTSGWILGDNWMIDNG